MLTAPLRWRGVSPGTSGPNPAGSAGRPPMASVLATAGRAAIAVVPRRITRDTSKKAVPPVRSSAKNVRWITRPICGLPVVMLVMSYSGTFWCTATGSKTYWNFPPWTARSPCSMTAPGVMSV